MVAAAVVEVGDSVVVDDVTSAVVVATVAPGSSTDAAVEAGVVDDPDPPEHAATINDTNTNIVTRRFKLDLPVEAHCRLLGPRIEIGRDAIIWSAWK